MFESLTEKLNSIFASLTGKGKLSEANIKDALKEVRMALLEADVNFKVAREFIEHVRERAIGQEVLGSLTPGQQVVKIVHEELIKLMGSKNRELRFEGETPHAIMICGLQGSGKTTTCGKLAVMLRKKGMKVLLTACDVYRPAAITQLEVLGKQINIPVFSRGTKEDPVKIAVDSLEEAKKQAIDAVIIDTAGRLHVDVELMEELRRMASRLPAPEKLLVVDAMTGQDAVTIAKEFNDAVGLTGIILTKLDGDARGGAALSIQHVTGTPVKFIGVGEKLDALEPFHPDRMASRILGMGDVLSLIERVQANVDAEKAKEMERKLREAEFTLEDYLEQLKQIEKMGSLRELISMIPGFGQIRALKGIEIDERELKWVKAIISSMTRAERHNPSIIDGSRKRRIAAGSGRTVQEVNNLLKQYEQIKKMMKQFSRMSKGGMMKNFKLPFM